MQTTQNTITLAGTQTPLLKQEQLRVGMLLTGIALTHVWEIMDLGATHMDIRKLPSEIGLHHNGQHNFVAVGRGQSCASCGLRREEIKEFLPLQAGKARVHVLVPRGEVLEPQMSTVYAGLIGNTLKFYHLLNAQQWDEALPVYPELHKVWEIPKQLRDRSWGTGPSAGEELWDMAPVEPED